MAESNPTLGEDTPPVSDDFLQGDIHKGLDALRRRLLDLSGRNRLLNYRYGKKSALRVIDEVPDQLFDLLSDGRELTFRPVPTPRRSEYYPGEIPAARAYAEKLGLRTEFDLPDASVAALTPDDRHADREIQTLHYGEELEGIMRSLSSAARLAIEETGTNMLYLAFGFLEWYEAPQSDQPRLSPLVLLPVAIRKADTDSRTGLTRYAIQYSGEDIGSNLTLQERLKRDFQLDVPDLGEEQTPEEYWQSLTPLLKRDERWRIRRHVTLTLLSFGKLMLFRDLDPRNWPQAKSPAEHPRIREFFEGIQRSGLSYAQDYDLDAAALESRVPPIVDEADSSQHSALVDAIEGKNLVIEGPPGTGKSQTICNLIGAALHAGKTVLFVSEKLAALEVVRHRLDGLGLGQFCLELHSHKTQKRRLLDDVKQRLAGSHGAGAPAELSDRLQHLATHKKLLTEYAELINRPYGSSRMTLQGLMWSAARRRSLLACHPDALASVELPNPQALTPESIDDLRRGIERFAKSFQAAVGSGELKENPWLGVRNPNITFLDEREVVSLVDAVAAAAETLLSAIEDINGEVGSRWLGTTIGEAKEAAAQIARLPADTGDIRADILDRLRLASNRRAIAEFISALKRLAGVASQLIELCGAIPSMSEEDARRASGILSQSVAISPRATCLEDYAEIAERLNSFASDIDRAVPAITAVAEMLGQRIGEGKADAEAALEAINAASKVSPPDIGYRSPGLLSHDAERVLRAASIRRDDIATRRERYDRQFDLAEFKGSGELREFVATTANAGFFAFLSPTYRSARRRLIAAARGPFRADRATVRQSYRELLDITVAEETFAADTAIQRVCGAAFDGLRTPFAELIRLVEWDKQLSAAQARCASVGLDLRASLWSAPESTLQRLRESESRPDGLSRTLSAALQAAADGPPLLSAAAPSDEAFPGLSMRLMSGAQALQAAYDALAALQFPKSVRLENGNKLLALVLEYHTLSQRIAADISARRILGENFSGSDDQLRQIALTFGFVDTVESSAVSLEVKHWLLHADAALRLSALRTRADTWNKDASALENSWKAFVEFTQLMQDSWLNGSLAETSLGQLSARAKAASQARERLSLWIDLIAARKAAAEAGLQTLCGLIESRVVAPAQAADAFDFVVDDCRVRSAIRGTPHLARFTGLSHEDVRQRFQRLDREAIALTRRLVAAVVSSRAIPAGNGVGPVSSFTELHLLERELEKQTRHIPLRQLMRRAGGALQALKPCFMMGPLSVAHYLQPGMMKFDMVIMDEASQLKPEDAVGAVARAGQIVIVGDSKQLPPTSFFDRLGEDSSADGEESGAESLTDVESILDVAASVYKPTRLLRWHYRSRHGSLIAFSNKEFYRGELIVYPSPDAKSPELGVKRVFVSNGLYENRRNELEAKRVVDIAIKHMAERPDESLGIVTLNATQRELIEDMFESRIKREALAEGYIQRHTQGLEPFFIKNLENVQGDERDVIYISTTFGKSRGGQVFQRFGPISGATGHRRLNVLFTRARRRTVLFTSMHSSDVIVQPTSSAGVRALKGYLHFAETGHLESSSLSGKEPDSDFEIEVAEALRSHNLDVVAQVGVSGYFIDLAIKDPRRPDSFILGIECDGATYHSSKSARDRDRLREKVLEGLGWKLHRIWSTDWFKDRATQVNRIVDRVRVLLQAELPEVSAEDVESAAVEPLEPVSWQGEESFHVLSDDEAREALLIIRAELEQQGRQTQSDSLLRDEMISALLRFRPRSHQEFLRTIPLELRLDTDGGEVKQHLPRVLEVLEKLDR